MNKKDIVVQISHPHGELELSLDEWERTGPGSRPLLRPFAVRNGTTGVRLPLTVIPFKYRNTALSRILIRVGFIKSPWGKLGH